MDVNKNSYTFGFAAVMVIIVAALLSVAAISLKPYQDRNIELEKKIGRTIFMTDQKIVTTSILISFITE